MNDITRKKQREYPITPPPTPSPYQTDIYFGWYSEANQQLRIQFPTQHKYKGETITSPPYTYWMQGDKKVLVTDVTHSSIPTQKQVLNGDIYRGQVDRYWGRSYTRL